MLSRTLTRAATRCLALAALAVTGLPTAHAGAAPPEPSADSYRSAGTIASWYELRLAQGTPRGIVLVLHGGAWRNVGATPLRQLADYRGGELVREWRARGFITVLSTYGSGEASWADVVAVYDQLHARYPDLPIGAYGQSSGGQLALCSAPRETSRSWSPTPDPPTGTPGGRRTPATTATAPSWPVPTSPAWARTGST
jgi:acetyl esterase/lipase